jgi:hypothetical protein
MIRKLLTLILALVLTVLTAGSAQAEPKGPQQLVDAFDAAWTRVIASGQYRNILNGFLEPIPGVIDATDYIINQSDCLPNTELTPFPGKPKGRFKEILENAEIRRGQVLGAPWFVSGGRNVADWFSGGQFGSDMSQDVLDAILAEIAAHYDTGPISIVDVEIPFPFNTTSALQDGIFGFSVNVFSTQYPPFQPVQLPGVTVDFLDQFNAKGGESEDLRRLKGRRPTCTLSSSGQFIHVPVGSPFTINSIDDLLADSSIRICTGNLSTQLSNQYFPNNPVTTKRSFDISECYEDLRDGLSDVMIFSLPVLPTAAQVGVAGGPALQPSVNTFIVAGTPYWTKQDDIICEAVASPPFPPTPFGTFRECHVKETGNTQ